jgi:hypothetical protein
MYYKVYRVADGRILGPAEILDCVDDAAVITATREVNRQNDVEVWQGDRPVIFICAQEKS